MTSEKRLLRSRKALIGGVCAGVADYFNVDPVIVRIIMVVFTLASGGLLGIAYILLWIVLPLEPKEEAPLDVHPQSVHSETYGTFEFGGTPRKTESGAQNAPNPAQAAGWRYAHPPYASAAHVPPEPRRRIARLCRCACRCFSFVCASGEHSHEGWMHAAPQQQPPAKSSRSGVKAALFAGSFLLFFGMSAMVASMVEGVVWWQYWPLIFVILGIVGMVVPGEEGHRMRQFVDSLITFFRGSGAGADEPRCHRVALHRVHVGGPMAAAAYYGWAAASGRRAQVAAAYVAGRLVLRGVLRGGIAVVLGSGSDGRAGFLGAVRARVSFRHAAVGKHRSKRVRCDLDNRMSVLVALQST